MLAERLTEIPGSSDVFLGVNAIEFMPWTAWPEDGFSWGYDPYAFFSVEHRFYNDPAQPLLKLFRLQRLISVLHDAGIHVIMDGVFNHAKADPPVQQTSGISRPADWCPGFGYYWMYQVPADSPYVGNFADAAAKKAFPVWTVVDGLDEDPA